VPPEPLPLLPPPLSALADPAIAPPVPPLVLEPPWGVLVVPAVVELAPALAFVPPELVCPALLVPGLVPAGASLLQAWVSIRPHKAAKPINDRCLSFKMGLDE
jgi:hypothetical protein